MWTASSHQTMQCMHLTFLTACHKQVHINTGIKTDDLIRKVEKEEKPDDAGLNWMKIEANATLEIIMAIKIGSHGRKPKTIISGARMVTGNRRNLITTRTTTIDILN